MQAAGNVASYYFHLTDSYLKYSPETYGWHYGIWEPGVRTHSEALLRSNRLLLRGLDITPDTRILDVGCGVGGFATWAAAEFGCRVTGITICPLHLTFAWQLAVKQGVSQLCDFLPMDMAAMTFPDESFDVVVNQETMCHAPDKGQYLKQVHRILKPNGVWRAIEFSMQESPRSRGEDELYRAVREDWYIPSLLAASEVNDLLYQAGFAEVETGDVTELVGRTARAIIVSTRLHRLLSHLGLDWLLSSRDPERRMYYEGHVRAGVAYSRGLLRGPFRHNTYQARKSA